jgi:hypothetical protein
MMGSTASFHRNDAGGDRFGKAGNTLRPHTSPLHHTPNLIQPHKAAAVLAQIDPENRYLPCLMPYSLRLPQPAYAAGT